MSIDVYKKLLEKRWASYSLGSLQVIAYKPYIINEKIESQLLDFIRKELAPFIPIPSPKIVGARSPRPDENIADASAPPSLQGGRSLNIGRGNPAPTEPRRGSYLKILPHTPEGLFIDERLEHHGAMGCIQDTSIQLKCR